MAEQQLELGKEYPPQGEESQIEQILTISKMSMENSSRLPMLRNQHPRVTATFRESLSLKKISLII